MCIRDSAEPENAGAIFHDRPDDVGADAVCTKGIVAVMDEGCLLYTSDAADERSSVDLGGRRII